MNVLPNTQDTIVAVSSAWAPSSVGILRLSGPDAFNCLGSLVHAPVPDSRRGTLHCQVELESASFLPADLFWFRAPHSYTGQDVIELHVPGSPPLLRLTAARLIEAGARRALPGEFTARAFDAGKLDAGAVERVSALIYAESAAQARTAARSARTSERQQLATLREQLLELRARIEAGIDFVDEEDVRFISPQEVVTRLNAALKTLADLQRHTPDWRTGRLHVALAGLPNAGKSTLFNALIGTDRAVVSPVLGTTRDVLSAEITLGRTPIVLQDCAGLGHTPNELELAAHVAAEQTADAADLVLWAHPAGDPWSSDERAAVSRLDPSRCLIVTTKMDQITDSETVSEIAVSAVSGLGLDHLSQQIEIALETSSATQPSLIDSEVSERIRNASLIAAADTISPGLSDPELISFELRWVDDRLAEASFGSRTEDVLGWIFSQFCMGK